MITRVGIGYDVHACDPTSTKPLVLGGVRFADGPALVAHSDGDVITHAVIDALLGAAGLGDIGSWFPDDDPDLEGADSLTLLEKVVAALDDEGYSVGNVDCVVIADRPKIAPVRDEIIEALALRLRADVWVKGKRTEGVGALGRGEAIAAHAVACVLKGTP
jgi:2-C-methyl-D-erythritol 2,4-cyclodiphosphate synthase